MKTLFRALAALSLCGWMVASLAADVVVGSVVAARGDVFADSGGGAQPQPLAVNAPVHRGDTIVTGRGKVKVALSGGTILSIGENTRVHLANFAGTESAPSVRINLISGVLRPLVNRTTSTGSFEVETQTAIAAVRGTDWLIEATAESTAVALLRGRVLVTSRGEKRGSTLLQSQGHGTDVRRGQPPTPPVPWGRQRLADLLIRASYD